MSGKKASNGRAEGHPVRFKTIIVYDKDRIASETIDMLMSAPDGGFLGLDREQFHCFHVVNIAVPEMKKLVKTDEKANPRTMVEDPAPEPANPLAG